MQPVIQTQYYVRLLLKCGLAKVPSYKIVQVVASLPTKACSYTELNIIVNIHPNYKLDQ